MANATFRDLYNYAQTATRDEFGFHDPFPGTETYPKYMLHIYSNMQQVNVTRATTPAQNISIANFCFRPDEDVVVVYPVDNGTCDYSAGHTLPIDTEITKTNGWFTRLKTGGLVNEILRDILGPIVAGKEKAERSSAYGEFGLPVAASIEALYNELNAKAQELNAINKSYHRHVGSMIMVSSETEDQIEGLCRYMYHLIDQLESPDYINQIDSKNLSTFKQTLASTRASLDANMLEVTAAKQFLEKYCSD